MNTRTLATLLTLAGLTGPTLANPTDPITFPADSRVIDVVAQYGATPDDDTDDTDAIQKAFEENNGSGAVIYLRPGRYLISDTIDWMGRRSNTILQGAGIEHTTIQLVDHTQGFDNPNKPKHMFFTGGAPAQRFRNAIRDMTIDVGKGNPGATGMSFCANNQGIVRDVRIQSGPDGREAGAVGMWMDVPEVGPQLIKNVTIIGFDVGIRVRHSVNSVTFENITLQGQRKAGIDNHNNLVFFRNLKSTNAVPALINGGPDGVATIIDSELTGTGDASGKVAMLNEHPRSVMFARNVKINGYDLAIRDADLGPVMTGQIEEWISDAPGLLFPGPQKSLNLPAPQFPEVPHDPLDQWVSPLQFGGIPDDDKDDTEAIQRAIDSGATTVYLPYKAELPPRERANQPGWRGTYNISDTIVIRGNVRRIIGLEACIQPTKSLADDPDRPIWRFESGEHPVVVLERLRVPFGQLFDCPMIEHVADRDLVVRSFTGARPLRHTGKGRLFLEDVVGNAVYLGPGSRLYAEQFNLEGKPMKMTNDGGVAWIHGLKTEPAGPILETINGGTTEIIGAHLYKCVKWGNDAGNFFVKDAKFSLVGGGEYAWTPSWASEQLVQETRGGETRELTRHMLPNRGSGSMIPLVAAYPGQVQGTPPGAPVVEQTAQTAASITLAFSGSDPDDDLAGFQVTRDGRVVGLHRAAYSERGLEPDSRVTYKVAAYDRFGNLGPATPFIAQTPKDEVPPTTPEALRTLRVTDRQVHLLWKAAHDEIGVVGYRVIRKGPGDDKHTYEVQATEWVDKTVTPGDEYAYHIVALDRAGNASSPAVLKAQTLAHAPTQITVRGNELSRKHPKVKTRGDYVGDLHDGTWVHYADLELGREKPFDTLTLRYGCHGNRAGTRIEVYLDADIRGEGDQTSAEGGKLLATLLTEDTGGWTQWRDVTVPVEITEPGKHSITFVVHRGQTGPSNSLVNIDRFTFAAQAAGEVAE